MAYKLATLESDEWAPLTWPEVVLHRFDAIEGTFDDDLGTSFMTDEILYARSALEFVRDQLPPERAALLNRADAYFRAHPREFNHAFRYEHERKRLTEELEGWVEDENGDHPRIPLSHWWWWPLPVEEEGA